MGMGECEDARPQQAQGCALSAKIIEKGFPSLKDQGILAIIHIHVVVLLHPFLAQIIGSFSFCTQGR
jgi:hypothetical protein